MASIYLKTGDWGRLLFSVHKWCDIKLMQCDANCCFFSLITFSINFDISEPPFVWCQKTESCVSSLSQSLLVLFSHSHLYHLMQQIYCSADDIIKKLLLSFWEILYLFFPSFTDTRLYIFTYTPKRPCAHRPSSKHATNALFYHYRYKTRPNNP